jgi:hypothetical protein
MRSESEALMSAMRLLLVFTATLGLAGCAAQHHPLTAKRLNGCQLATTQRPPTPFFVTEPGKGSGTAGAAVAGGVAGGAIGGRSHRPVAGAIAGAVAGGAVGGILVVGAMADAGTRIVREYAVADPTSSIARLLSEDLQRRYGLALAPQSLYIADDDPKQLSAAHPSADLVLDVSIVNWSLEPLPHDTQKYRVRYTAKLRLIDAKLVHLIDGKRGIVIADGSCSYIPEETPNAPTYDQFLANGAQRLKPELELAARFCVDEFRSKVLSSDPAR